MNTHIKNLITLILLIFMSNAASAQYTITGTVIDKETGEPLIGCSVLIKGTTTGAMTDIEGKFKIIVPEGKHTLVFNYIGYTSKSIEVDGKESTLNVVLDSGVHLSEVVVTGYSVPKSSYKSSSVGSVSGVSASSRKSRKAASAYKGSKTLSSGAAKKETTKAAKKTKWVKRKADKNALSANSEDALVWCLVEIDDEGNEIKTLSKKEITDSKTEAITKSTKTGLLTAGELHDFSKWELWKDIASKDLKQWSAFWNIKPTQRFTVQLINKNDYPIIDATVELKNKLGKTVWTTKTDNTGKAELWANAFSFDDVSKNYNIYVKHKRKREKLKAPKSFQESINTIQLKTKCDAPNQVDIMFVVDATGSMSDELEYLKMELNDVIQQVKSNHENLNFKLGSVFYRDIGDEYLSRSSKFSTNINNTIDFIKEQRADGGGDGPEAVEVALEKAIESASWSKIARTRLLFLLLDAPPHNTPKILKKLERSIKKAAQKGIRIIPISGSGIDKSTEYLMRSMALLTNGTYVFLTDDSGIGDSHIKPTTDNFKVEILNNLLLRLFKQYLHTPDCNDEEWVKEALETELANTNSAQSTQNEVDENEDNASIEQEIAQHKIYPNPTSGQVNLEVSTPVKTLFITDYSGKIIQRLLNLNEGTHTIDLSIYPSGVYFLRFQFNGKWKTEKVILVR